MNILAEVLGAGKCVEKLQFPICLNENFGILKLKKGAFRVDKSYGKRRILRFFIKKTCFWDFS